MPSVTDILTMVKNQALVGSGGAADDTRIMLYMNRAYADIYRETARDYPQALLTSQSITLSSGLGTISSAPHKILRVKETGSYNFLEARTLIELEQENPRLDATGSPRYYYMTSDTAISCYPIDGSSIVVRYIPRPSTLASDGAETTIKIPPEYHDLLLWGTLVYMAYDERDKGFGTEIGLSKAKYDEAMESYKRWLAYSHPRKTLRTEQTPV